MQTRLVSKLNLLATLNHDRVVLYDKISVNGNCGNGTVLSKKDFRN